MASQLEKRLKELDKQRAKGTITDDEYQARRAAIISAPEVGGSRAGPFRWGLMGCLGMVVALVVVFIIVIVLIAVAVKGSSHKDAHAVFAEGSSGTVTTAGGVKNKVTINKITDPAVSTNQFEQPKVGYHYITVAVTIENVGTHETTGVDVKLRTTDATEYEQTFVTGVGASDLNALKSLTSGGKTDAVFAFEVKDSSSVQWLKFDPNIFAPGDLYFDKQ